jgi:uncharacterized membrane protein
MHNIIIFLIFLAIFASLDFFWIGFVMNGYRAFFGDILRIASLGKLIIYWLPAFIAYLLFAFAPCFFIFHYATNDTPLSWFLIQGAVLGLVIYGIYDMTNWAVIKRWKISMVIVDITWGIILYATSVTLVGWIGKHFMLFN